MDISGNDTTALKALQEADRRKDEFMAMLAHELRNHLAPMRNALHIFDSPAASANMRVESRGVMERQLQQMLRLVDDLLDASRIGRGTIELRKNRTALSEVLMRALETSRPLIDGASHRLTIQMQAAPIWVDADIDRLAQVFSNLLNNAAKYTRPSGHIRLSCHAESGTARVIIRDDGIGIPPTMLPHIFDTFTQVDSSMEHAQGGLGIGLALVKTLVELHGGSVDVKSDGAECGSTFTVTLPLV